ncbi:hypothetical protein KVR01_001442 [Diaporthe batatas]|uniref:uncharacterized protein n=1 Tax=Diaporthe batatas TaxID=748121 RepID=UPI001D045AC2|nr:uncharacterized protein KVR01_001442 [Diaporthe batatas]KAG8168693.1 hypothetical protein KVR01_001442 [Diaporthe batatas]
MGSISNIPVDLGNASSTATTRLTALQTGLFAASISQPGTWVGSHVFPLPLDIDLARFKSAWSTVVDQNEILRSRIIWDQGQAEVPGSAAGEMRLVVLDEEEIDWEERLMEGDGALAVVTKELRTRDMGFGEKLSAYTILRIRDGPLLFIWTMHHALYDNSHLLLLDDVIRLYHGHQKSLSERPSFTKVFLKKAKTEADRAAAAAFWTSELSGCEDAAIFPSVSGLPAAQPQTRIETPYTFPAPKRSIVADATNSILIQAAWAAVVAKHTATKHVVFGCTVSGRYDPETKDVVGPTFATVPVRVRLDDEDRETLLQSLEHLQASAANARVYEQVGLQFIQDLNPSTKRAASFQNLLVIQPKNHPTPAPVVKKTTFPRDPSSNGKLEFVKTHLDLTQTYGLVMEVTPSSSGQWLLVAKYDDRLFSAQEVKRICCHFSKAIQEVFREENRDLRLREIDMVTDMDLEIIKGLASEPRVIHSAQDNESQLLLHQEFERQARLHPSSMAIDAWDLSLTYAQLDAHSTDLAEYLRSCQQTAGPQVNQASHVIPICFSKSAYAVVAMLGILKSGSAYLPIDAGWPDERIAAILSCLQSKHRNTLGLVLCDSEQEAKFRRRGLLRKSPPTTVLTVDNGLLRHLRPSTHQQSAGLQTRTSHSPQTSPSSLAYVIFTSGSTGSPKGIAMSHKACTTNFRHRLSRLQSFSRTTRVLQFSSFAFDVSIFDIFGTLSAGGCVVIPHETFRVNPSRLSQFMTEKRVNWASLPPTFAELLSPHEAPTLETLILGGELLTREVIARWKTLGPSRVVRLGNELGPSETCVACAGNYDVALETDPRDLGRPVGGNKMFLVDMDDSSRLVPVGCVGELVVYGDSVMSEYLDDPVKTDEAFTELPDVCTVWLQDEPRKKAFKTGDLFWLNAEGRLMFVGRKDRQLKWRGFRLEAEEVESCIKLADGVNGAVVDLTAVRAAGRDVENAQHTGQELIAFFTFEDTQSSTARGNGPKFSTAQARIVDPSSSTQIPLLVRRTKALVKERLPHYMAPTLYVPITHIPTTSSGKQDRNQLLSLVEIAPLQIIQEIQRASRFDSSSAEMPNGQHVQDQTPLSPTERALKTAWTRILGLVIDDGIGHTSNFFRLGGNSIKAIQLSSLASKMGLANLTVASIHEFPTLRGMAAACSNGTQTDHTNERKPTAEQDVNVLTKQRICAALRIRPVDVGDIYPCTPLQQGLLAASIRQPGTYVASRMWRLSGYVNLQAFREAWNVAIKSNEILRTSIAEDDGRFWQVSIAQIREDGTRQVVEEREIRGLEPAEENRESVRRLGLDENQSGRRLSFVEILNDQTTGQKYFKWTIHHAVYDAWVLSMVWSQVKHFYELIITGHTPGLQIPPHLTFGDFVRKTYPANIPTPTARFWQDYLSASEPWPAFPTAPISNSSVAQTDSVTSTHIDLSLVSIPGVTEASLIRAAWAWVQSLHLGVDDVVFGVTLSGRTAPGASTVVGPTITTVPVRVAVSQSMRITDFLSRVQQEANAMVRYEHTGLPTIRDLGESASWACGFRNLLVVQDNRGQPAFAWDGVEAVSADTDIRHPVPLVLECDLEDSGLTMHAIFDSKFISRGEVEFLLAHLGRAVESLSQQALAQPSSPGERVLGDIDFLSKMDEAWITDWNQEAKPSADRLIHEVFSERARQCGANSAVDAWDVHFTYQELDDASDAVAVYLIQQGLAKPGDLIALCFDKSGWAVLAMLSVWKAGCGFVPLDLNHPRSRSEEIISATRAKVALCSTSRLEQSKGLLPSVVLALDHDSLAKMRLSNEKAGNGGRLPSAQLSRPVTPRDICYVLFTSGSTGRPKGVVLEHASVCTSLLGHAAPMNVDSESRVLQFAAYTFDTSIGEIFTALLVGATLCVPSDVQRMNSLAEFINDKYVSFIWLTPTVAGFLDPQTVPGVKAMVIGGEPGSAALFEAWIANGTSIVYGYGPTETSITVTLDLSVTAKTDPAKIGWPICASTWVVDPDQHSRLLPVGCVGELVVSGPTVGRGYLDELRTSFAFGEIPDAWENLAHRGNSESSGQRERFYKTGDLVRYDVTGNIVFVGRKDDQVKVRGQRIELSEITDRINQILGERCSSFVEKTEISNPELAGDAETRLVAFFTLPPLEGDQGDEEGREHWDIFCHPSPATIEIITDIETKLRAQLPSYMVPSLWVPLRSIPLTTSGKIDRNKVKTGLLQVIDKFGCGAFMPESNQPKAEPREELERQLRDMWSAVLGLRADQIGIHDSFLRLGGDSLKAIVLARAARRAGYHLSVADIFLRPVLSEMADLMRDSMTSSTSVEQGERVSQNIDDIPLFSMLAGDIEAIKKNASAQCGITLDDIEDIYPCTAMQIGMVVASSLSDGDEGGEPASLYLLRRHIVFESAAACDTFSAAWAAVRSRKPILRTCVIQHQSTFYQVVVKDDADLSCQPPGPETGIYRRLLADFRTVTANECEISLHHAVYDAVLLPHLLQEIRHEYLRLNSGPTAPLVQSSSTVPFRNFIHYLENYDEKAAYSFWSEYLPSSGDRDKIAQETFPPTPQQSPLSDQQPTGAATVEFVRHFTGGPAIESKTYFGTTLANIINAAWAAVVARHTGAEDLVLGNTLSGRDVVLENSPNGALIDGPTLTTVPVRFQVGRDKPVSELLREAQRDAAQIRKHQHLGMAKIAKAGNCKFGTLLVVQTLTEDIATDSDDVLAPLENLPGLRGFHGGGSSVPQEYPLVLECLVNKTHLTGVRAYYDERAIQGFNVAHLLAHLERSIRTLIAPSKQNLKLGDIDLVTNTDVSQLTAWNSKPHEKSQTTLLDLFLDRVGSQPGHDAIYSTGLSLSYEELDRYSSLAACNIAERLGAPREDRQTPFVIAVCYEKSVCAIVSILAVMKLGAAYVPLDPSSPHSRLEMILDDVKPSAIVCSPRQAQRFSGKLSHPNIILVGSDIHEQARVGGAESTVSRSYPVTPESLAYIFFTSGSTGRPKGVMVPHSAICTSILAFSPVVRLSQDSRVLQFSSFCFDASVGEIFATLSAGGCVCLPDDEERLADVSGFMNEARVNWAFLTPVTLRVITPDDVPLLRVLVVGGEPLPPSLFKTWAARPDRLQLMEAYGPTECCVFSTMNTTVTPDTHPQDMGFALGGATWVVDSADYHRLAPVGCVGELVISGNTVAAGYHNLPAHSASGFLDESPGWAELFPEHAAGRMYRTGDLVRFNHDGSIRYVARKDNQVNLRGMRIELGEIEYHLARSAAGSKAAPIVVIANTPNHGEETKEKAFLACFFVVELAGKIAPEPLRMTKQRREVVQSIVSYMQDKVPSHMIPTVFIPLPGFPENTSGKVERRVLVEDILGGFDEDDFKHYSVSVTTQAPDTARKMTPNEQKLRQVWSQLLGVDSGIIKPDDSFLRLGGDSVDVIRMVTTLRQEGWHLSPVETLADPRLSSVASKIKLVTKHAATAGLARTTPFSLLRRLPGTVDVERLTAAAETQCSVPRGMIEDIYPCTALQEGLLTISEKVPGSYFYRQAWSLDEGVDVDRLLAAYRGLCKAHPILRTRIIRGDDDRAYQVVLREDFKIVSGSSDAEDAPCRKHGSLVGKPLHWVSITLSGPTVASKYLKQFVRTIHHALYDAWSLVNLETELNERYMAAEAFVPPKTTDYTQFIRYITEDSSALPDEYWKQHLDGARRTLWPAVPHGLEPQTNICVTKTFQLEWSKSRTSIQNYTKASVAHLAWALLLGKHSNETDVTFGLTLSGRDAPVEGIERMTGPTNLTVPIRYRLSDSNGRAPSIAEMLESVQNQTREKNRFQHHGMKNIARVSPDARAACDFRSLLVIQPARQLQQWAESRNKILKEVLDDGPALVHPYAIIVELCFQSHSDGVGVWVHYDDRLLSGPQVDLIVRQLHRTLEALVSSEPSTSIDALDLTDEMSLGQMKRFHEDTCNSPAETSIVSLVSHQLTLNATALAISAWDGEMTYADLDILSSGLATYLRDTLRLKPESTTAICLEKSVWAVVAMLAIMKAGGAYAPVDPSAPDAYKAMLLDQIAADTKGSIVLASEGQSESIKKLVRPGTQVLTITKSMISSLPSSPDGLNMATPGSAAYVLFTSGSTGVSKGVVMEHRSACTSILAHGAKCKFSPSTRALQFAAFTFDASIMEVWTTLAFGGCICMPSESQRVDNLEQYMQDSRVTWAFLTPTVSSLVRKDKVPSLNSLVLGGEALTDANIQKWAATAKHEPGNSSHELQLMNGYGPTECCVFTCVNANVTRASDPRDVGRATGVSAWVVDPNDHNRLMPLTCPGELVIIGSTLARGYLGDAAKTEQAFVYPRWSAAVLGGKARAYRTGDLASCGLDGHIMILGRIDSQIKLNGMRVELGEIENALLSCVSDVAAQVEVMVVNEPEPSASSDGGGVVAFMAFGGAQKSLVDIPAVVGKLSSQMAARLPKYMIPNDFIAVSRFPTTTAGKVDRRALRQLIKDPENSACQINIIHRETSVSARTSTKTQAGDDGIQDARELALRDLWAETLRIEDSGAITRHDDFFMLGGESIRAIRLVAAARERYGMFLTVDRIFRHPVLADMAAQMSEIVELDGGVQDEPFDLLDDGW